jgi:Dyp-type peroxidase family
MSGLERDDIQGNVVRGYNFPFVRYVVARVREPDAARRWVAAQADPVTSDREWDAEPPPAYNLALSFAGLRALGLPARLLDTFPQDFRDGMAARASETGDAGDGAPETWQRGLRAGDMHVVLTFSGSDERAVADESRRVRGELDADGLSFVVEQRASLLPDPDAPERTERSRREHFGFTDGFGQPAIAGVARDNVPGQGVVVRRRPWTRLGPDMLASATDRRVAWRALAPGEFVLGYDDEDGGLPPAPAAPLHRNGTFMVWRKLHQDVAGFRAFLEEAAAGTRLTREGVAARLIGRWPDGSPLMLRPHQGDERLGNDRARVNDFAYRGDRDGRVCPRGAHVRRVNPRDALAGGDGRLTARHRILRRGMPYGDPLPEGAPGDGADRGLIFVCLQASIERQFETVQAQWCNDGDAFGLGAAADPVSGSFSAETRVTFGGRPPRYASCMRAFVTPRGGEYLFVPGISGLRALASI